jgi:peptidoglycan hydrolase CwlO-like protein
MITMTVSDADCIWRHPHHHTPEELALACIILDLVDEYGLSEGDETYEELKEDRDRLQDSYNLVCEQIDRMDEIIAEQDAKIDSLECKLANKEDTISTLYLFIRDQLGLVGAKKAQERCKYWE